MSLWLYWLLLGSDITLKKMTERCSKLVVVRSTIHRQISLVALFFPSITTTCHQHQRKTCLEVEPKTLAVNRSHCLSLNLPCFHYYLHLYENHWNMIIHAYPDIYLLGDSDLGWLVSSSFSFCLNSLRYFWYSYVERYTACWWIHITDWHIKEMIITLYSGVFRYCCIATW